MSEINPYIPDEATRAENEHNNNPKWQETYARKEKPEGSENVPDKKSSLGNRIKGMFSRMARPGTSFFKEWRAAAKRVEPIPIETGTPYAGPDRGGTTLKPAPENDQAAETAEAPLNPELKKQLHEAIHERGKAQEKAEQVMQALSEPQTTKLTSKDIESLNTHTGNLGVALNNKEIMDDEANWGDELEEGTKTYIRDLRYALRQEFSQLEILVRRAEDLTDLSTLQQELSQLSTGRIVESYGMAYQDSSVDSTKIQGKQSELTTKATEINTQLSQDGFSAEDLTQANEQVAAFLGKYPAPGRIRRAAESVADKLRRENEPEVDETPPPAAETEGDQQAEEDEDEGIQTAEIETQNEIIDPAEVIPGQIEKMEAEVQAAVVQYEREKQAGNKDSALQLYAKISVLTIALAFRLDLLEDMDDQLFNQKMESLNEFSNTNGFTAPEIVENITDNEGIQTQILRELYRSVDPTFIPYATQQLKAYLDMRYNSVEIDSLPSITQNLESTT